MENIQLYQGAESFELGVRIVLELIAIIWLGRNCYK